MVDTAFYINKGPFSLSDIADIIDAKVVDESNRSVQIFNIASIEKAAEKDICFFYDKKAKEKASNIKASACVTTEELASFIPKSVTILVSNNPKLAFLKLNQAFYTEKKPIAEIAASAKISRSAKIGSNCYIGENVVIAEEVTIGDNCIIEHNAVIEQGCQIGNNTRVGVGASISHAIIGQNCYIYTGARIGYDGFGFMMIDGRHQRIPQVGRVIRGNDVEVGANTCIDRGALDDTIIGDGCRIDNLVQIAHNDKLGRGCVIVSQTGIAGSCTFGDYVVCGGQTGFADHLNIGSGAQIGAQSGLMRDVEAGSVVMGYPAVPIKDFMRQVSFIQKNANPKK